MIDIVIITRTFNRPKYFAMCLRSITDQFFAGNIYHLIIDETEKKNRYAERQSAAIRRKNYHPLIYYVKHRDTNGRTMMQGDIELYHTPWNENMTFALNKAIALKVRGTIKNHCVVCYLDDDDKYCSGYTLNRIADTFSSTSQMWFWRVRFQYDLIVPSLDAWQQAPESGNISSIGFAHSLELSEYSDWGNMSRGDFRTAANIFKHAKTVTWIDEILSMVQNSTHEGKGGDL
jgi:glycosyltransferase involved in cell wall biosynthesis